MVGRDRTFSSSEFWELSPEEVLWALEARRPRKMYGKMTEEEVKELYESSYGPSE